MGSPRSAREVLVRSPADSRLVPWKNGRGTTEELAIWPPTARFEEGDFEWRVSRTRVEESGPFSTFPGFDRILVITSGTALTLAHGDHAARTRLRALEPHRFSGDWPTTGELVAGPVSDFNVVFQRESTTAEVEVLRLGRRRARETFDAVHAFVHVAAGGATARVTGEDDPIELRARDSLWVRRPGAFDEIEMQGTTPDALVLVVRIGRAADGDR